MSDVWVYMWVFGLPADDPDFGDPNPRAAQGPRRFRQPASKPPETDGSGKQN